MNSWKWMSRSPVRYFLALFISGLIAYLPFVQNQLFWDDEQFIYKNQYVQTFDISKIFTTNTIAGAGEVSNYYRPLTTLSFALDYQLWGINPIGFHLTNTIMHTLAGVVLFAVLLEIGLSQKPAFLISLVFLIHPIQTEAVAYANSRGDSLYALFGFLGLLCLAKALHQKTVVFSLYDGQFILTRAALAALSVVFYLCSILAKEIGIAVGGLYWLMSFQHLVVYTQAKGVSLRQLKLKLVSYKQILLTLLCTIGIATTYLWLRLTILRFQPALNLYGETPYGTSITIRLLTFLKIVLVYARLLLLPFPLHMEREIEVVEHIFSVWPLLTILLFASLIFLAYKEFRRRKTAWIFIGLGWFLITLLPVSGILPINGMLYEHWLYVPLVGFFLILYGMSVQLPKAIVQVHNSALKTLSFVIIPMILLLTWRQNYLWANPIRFYTYTLQYTNTARVHNNLAMAYAASGNIEQAITHYQTALQLSNAYPQTHHNLANAYAAIGQTVEAEHAYKASLSLNSRFYPSYTGLINLYVAQEQYDQATEVIEAALKIFPNDANMLNARSKLQQKRLQAE